MTKTSVANDNKKSKKVRHDTILRLINKEIIGTQEELAFRLNQEGFDITQATVSRDIKELHLVKHSVQGQYRYTAPKAQKNDRQDDKFFPLYKSAVLKVDMALNQVVIHCYNGMANAVCAAFDSMEADGVIGTIAGDDTILIITKSEQIAKQLVDKLSNI